MVFILSCLLCCRDHLKIEIFSDHNTKNKLIDANALELNLKILDQELSFLGLASWKKEKYILWVCAKCSVQLIRHQQLLIKGFLRVICFSIPR